MIIDFYHPEVVLMSYPGTVLAEGIAAAENYWKQRCEAEKERTVELVSILDLGDKAICSIRQLNPEKGSMTDKVIIVEIKEDKIIRTMLID